MSERIRRPAERTPAPLRGPSTPAPIRAGGDASHAHRWLTLQRSAGNAAVSRLATEEDPQRRSPVLDVVKGGSGRPLDGPIKQRMEASFGTDFSSVRVHTDPVAARSARSVQADAYTVGEHVVFGEGGFRPSSDSGQRMIAHELAHVVQQRQGPVSGVSHGGGIRVSEPGDRFERAADHAAALAVQRHPGGHDEEDVLPVQRHRSGLPLRADLLP